MREQKHKTSSILSLKSITLRYPSNHVQLKSCWIPGCFKTGKENVVSWVIWVAVQSVYLDFYLNIHLFIAQTLPKYHTLCNKDTFFRILFLHVQQFWSPQCIFFFKTTLACFRTIGNVCKPTSVK